MMMNDERWMTIKKKKKKKKMMMMTDDWWLMTDKICIYSLIHVFSAQVFAPGLPPEWQLGKQCQWILAGFDMLANHLCCYRRPHTHTKALHRCLYTKKPLHRAAFTPKRFSHRSLFTDAFTHTHKLLHADAFTKRCFKVQLNYLDGYLSFLDHAKGFVTDSWCITSILGSQTKWGANLFNTH